MALFCEGAVSLSSAKIPNLARVKLNVGVTFTNNVTGNDLPLCAECQCVIGGTVNRADRMIKLDRISWLSVLVS